MKKPTPPRRRRARSATPDKPATIDELSALHDAPAWRAMVARTREEEARRVRARREEWAATVVRVLEDALSGKIAGEAERGAQTCHKDAL
jgi:hypothetical protein